MPNITSPLTARPTIYRGVEMRSRLEARVAQYFDAQGWEWKYEPFAFGSRRGQYMPDFRVTTARGVEYWESKGAVVSVVAQLWRMEIILSSDPNAVLVLWEPTPRMWMGKTDAEFPEMFVWRQIVDGPRQESTVVRSWSWADAPESGI